MQRNVKAAGVRRLVLLLTISGLFLACGTKSGPVGGGIIPEIEVAHDTLMVSGFQADSVASYTGKLTITPIGKYTDPIFGDVEAVAYIKPTIYSFSLDTTLDNSYSMYLDLMFDTTQVYGDSLSQTEFSVYKVTELWRSNELFNDTKPAYDESVEIASFTRLKEDSIRISLSQTWFAEYASFVNDTSATQDSSFVYDFYGLAIVAKGASSKISFPVPTASAFRLINEDVGDTTIVGLNDWGYSLDYANKPYPANKFALYNSLDRFYSFSLEEEVDSLTIRNLLKAELILYQDTDLLESSLQANSTRIDIPYLELKSGITNGLAYGLQFSSSEIVGYLDESINGYRFDVTSHVNSYIFDDPSNKTLYLHMNPANGLLRSTLLYDETAIKALKPKLILLTAK
tara:strand:- start:28801 stop:30000 length:1200 start_codon:yes stop_codon:yes gene_type:complete